MRKKIFCLLMITFLTTLTACDEKRETTSTNVNTTYITTEGKIENNSLQRTDDTSTGLIVNVSLDTGDEITVTINNKKTNTLHYDEEEKKLTIKDEDGNILQEGRFITDKWHTQYFDKIIEECEIIRDGFYGETDYVFYTYKNNEGEDVYEILSWTSGSNTGYITENNYDEYLTHDIFTDLSFIINETDQQDKYYHPKSNHTKEEYYEKLPY